MHDIIERVETAPVAFARDERAELVPLAPTPIVILPDIRDLKGPEDPLQPQLKPNFDRLNYLADVLDRLGEGRFSMRIWDGCLCGWANHMAGMADTTLAQVNPMHVAREWLGLSSYEANRLFLPKLSEYGDVTAKEAAKVVRHYIATGEVDWSIAFLEGVPRKIGQSEPVLELTAK